MIILFHEMWNRGASLSLSLSQICVQNPFKHGCKWKEYSILIHTKKNQKNFKKKAFDQDEYNTFYFWFVSVWVLLDDNWKLFSHHPKQHTNTMYL